MIFFDFPIIGTEKDLPLYLINMGVHECQGRIEREDGFAYPADPVLYQRKRNPDNRRAKISDNAAYGCLFACRHSARILSVRECLGYSLGSARRILTSRTS